MIDEEATSLWEHLKTTTVFDKQKFNNDEAVDIPKRRGNRFSPSSFLIEALVQYICTLVEEDLANQKNLYYTICQKLNESQLIDDSYMIKHFDFIRISYQKELHRLLTVAKSVPPSIQSSHVPVPVLPTKNSVGRCSELFECSRYYGEYHELEFIARGGFGEVVKVQNKLDAGIYAIKKICLRYCSINGFIRGLSEVQMLAKLNHPNIVSYKAAWLEPLVTFKKVPKRTRNALRDVENSESKKNSESSYILFVEPDNSKVDEKSYLSSESFSNVTDNNMESISKSASDFEGKYFAKQNRKLMHECGQDWAVLFIQMQLCHQTLRQWLAGRNTNATVSPNVNMPESLGIFLQIVRGIEFIHSKGIVHHDIKPNNIFISKDGKDVQVGDFGLSCCLLHDVCPDTPTMNIFSSSNCPVSATHQPGEIGTKPYAAPEQLKGICNFKSDLYSLGILLFELVYSFHTSMERIERINNLRDGKLPADLEKHFPGVARLIKRLVSRHVDLRPTATELLKELSGMSEEADRDEDTNPTITKLRHELMLKNEEIALLKTEILALQNQNINFSTAIS